MEQNEKRKDRPDWMQLLKEALTTPGKLSEAYRIFHNYSLGNILLAAIQLAERNMPLTPIASFNKWKDLGRLVKKGEKAIALIMPVTVKKKAIDESSGEETDGAFNIFILKRNWFTLDQTDGDEYCHQVVIPDWDKNRALSTLDIEEVRYESANGNCQGYARGRQVAVSPLAVLPHKTMFHELAHILLGHTGDLTMADSIVLPKCIKEAEAEATAYLCCATLELPGMVESRGYIQSWLNGTEFPEKSARRVFAAADKILKAGKGQ